MFPSSFYLLASLALHLRSVQAYIPASPTNTSVSSNVTDFVQINWLPTGQAAYNNALSRALVNTQGGNISGYRGALVHFSETNITTATGAPWIALINCDEQTSSSIPFGASSDAVSLALQSGAETAILYSLTSTTCALNSNFISYLNGSLDLYVTTSQAAAQGVVMLFNNVQPDAYWFNQTALENSRSVVNNQISALGGLPTTATNPSLFGSTAAVSSSTSAASAAPTQVTGSAVSYLIATIANAGANQNGTTATTQQQTGGGGGGPNTGLAMIILYAITGCVTLLFLVVILSGAIRAMRHPERYGPRPRGGPGGGGQSRAAGMTQAILDTFPVVKFLSGQKSAQEQREAQDELAGIKDEETGDAGRGIADSGNTDMVQMHVLNKDEATEPEISAAHNKEVSNAATLIGAGAAVGHDRGATDSTAIAGGDEGEAAAKAASAAEGSAIPDTTDPADVNDSVTCPICLLDFEDGDDLRILPCDARHRFHDACVVPWLLNVSSLCPLCRLDLAKDRDPAVTTDGSSGPGEGGEGDLESQPAEPRVRASTILANSFRSLLSPVPSGRRSLEAEAAPATEEGGEGQAATGSRFQRYVQQRRNRVSNRQRGLSMSSATAMPNGPAVNNPRQHGLSPSGIPLSTVRP